MRTTARTSITGMGLVGLSLLGDMTAAEGAELFHFAAVNPSQQVPAVTWTAIVALVGLIAAIPYCRRRFDLQHKKEIDP